MQFLRSASPLTNDQLMSVAPSIFATRPYERMSDRYSFIPTITVVDELRKQGFQPFSVTQSRTRIVGKSDFTKHLIRFRESGSIKPLADSKVGDLFPELVLQNAHDGTSLYELLAGLFRLACLNGLMVSDAQVSAMKVKHLGDVSDVINASFEVIERFPQVIEQVQGFQALQLTDGERKVYAETALSLRYDKDENGNSLSPVRAERLLTPRRYADSAPTLWNTYNTVQENLTKGGLHGYSGNGRRATTRKISSISEDVRLNTALWELTAKMKELKG